MTATRTVALFLLFFAYGITAMAETSDSSAIRKLPGGIIYSNGKIAIFEECSTGKKFNVTSCVKDAVKPPFSASQNGKWILRYADSKFQLLELPFGTPTTVQAVTFKQLGAAQSRTIAGNLDRMNGSVGKSEGTVVSGPDRKIDIIWKGDIKNLSLSPDGRKFCFDANHTATGWVMLDKGNPETLARLGTWKGNAAFRALPLYGKRSDSFDGIFYLSTRLNNYNPPLDNPFAPAFGNLVKWPASPFFKATAQDTGFQIDPRTIQQSLGNGQMGISTTGGPSTDDNRIYGYSNEKKSAHFLTWQKLSAWENGKKQVAYIYHWRNQWGPLEIRTLDDDNFAGGVDEFRPGSFAKNMVPESYKGFARELEIQATFPEVIGLAWKPDGSICVFTAKGDVYLIKAEDIQTAFAESRTEFRQDKDDRKMLSFASVNNVCQLKPGIIASGVIGTCFTWVSDQSFFFQDKDGNAQFWNQGRIEKVEDSTGDFCYVSVSPLKGIKNPEALVFGQPSSEKNVPSINGAGKALAWYGDNGGRFDNVANESDRKLSNKINFGRIQAAWHPHTNDSLRIMLTLSGKPLKFSILEDTEDLDSVTDPSKYEYYSSQKQKKTVLDRVLDKKGNALIHDENIVSNSDVIIPLRSVILLWLDDKCLGIKPLSFGLRYNSLDEMPAKEREKFERTEPGKELPFIPDSLSYEYRYWPNVQKGDTNSPESKPTSKAGIQKESNGNWEINEHPFGEGFYIGGTRFSWTNPDNRKDPSNGKKPKFFLDLAISYADKDKFAGEVSDDVRTSVLNPSEYKFGNMRSGCSTQDQQYFGYNWIKGQDFLRVFQIGEGYIAIKPVEERKGWVQYKWKYWPKDNSAPTLAKVGTTDKQ
jgi:hypothetical protein